MKKVLFLITKSNFGGAQRYVYDLATNLSKTTLEAVVAAGGNGWLLQECTQGGIRTVTLPSLGRDVSVLKDWRSLSEIRALLQQEKPDILHLNSSKAGFLGAMAGRLEKVPKIIFTAHGWSFNEKRPFYQRMLFRVIQGMTVLLAHTTIAVSEKIKRDTPLHKGVRLIRHGVSEITFADRQEAQTKLKTLSPDFDRERLTIGTIGELHTNKGHDILIEALSHLPKEGSWQAVIIGEGEKRILLESLIKKYNLQNRVFLPGHVDRAAQILKAFDVFVFPSRTEALGYALLEAGLAELPVVGSNIGGIPEVIEDGETGILVPKENAQALADALEKLINNSELREKYGRENRVRVKNQFSLARMIRETEAIYTS